MGSKEMSDVCAPRVSDGIGITRAETSVCVNK